VILGASYTILPGSKAAAPVAQAQVGKIAGTVTATTGVPLAAVISASNTTQSPVGTNPKTGAYIIQLPAGSYEITVSAQGFTSETTTLRVSNHEKTIADFMLKPNQAIPAPASGTEQKQAEVIEQAIQKMTISAQSIHFAIGSAKIRPGFYPALDELVQLLKDNPLIHILIQGNTDNSGPVKLNQKLSQERANAVMQYLIQHGIAPQRLQAKGYGETHPVEPNTTSGARAINRRVNIQYIIE
jgi:outer membrane protein OmpA-like peptidoglycan-associated protein